jgi:predicted acetyltransferase
MPHSRPTASIRVMSRDEVQQVLELDQWAFGYDVNEFADAVELIDTFDDDRVFGAWLQGPDGAPRLAGTYATYSLQVAVPGAQVPVAGLTWVAVHPRDRRRGVLRAMIDHHLDDVRTRQGEPFSMLHAAEPGIYGRFGYGPASHGQVLTLARGTQLSDVPGADDLTVDLEQADIDRHAELLGTVYAAARQARPGWVSRATLGQHRVLLSDPPQAHRGAENLRLLTVRGGSGAGTGSGELRGYVLFRRRIEWKDGIPDGTVEVRELVALDAAAARALWGRLTDLDLTSRVETPSLSVDDPLLHLLVDVRAARPRLHDGLWLRVVDLPATLAARRYATDLDVVLEVTDDLCSGNAGRWRLQGGPDGASCTRTDRRPDLGLDVRELGSAYLAGSTLSGLAAAGLITVHDPAALHRAAVAFSWPVAPYCPWTF